MNVQIGSIIKSYDFHYNTDCYMIGRVTEIEGDYINCVTIKVVYRGNVDANDNWPKTFSTPQMGCMMDDEDFDRIVVLD